MTLPEPSVVEANGVALPIRWAYEGAEAFAWERDTEHWPTVMPPMEAWFHAHSGAGIDRAWAEVGMEPPHPFYRFQCAGPFLYTRVTPYEPERLIRIARRYREVAAEHGGALRFWEESCRPRIEHARGEIAASDGTPLLQVAELWAYGFHQTFTSLALLFEPGMRLNAMLAEALGDEAALLATEVLQGGENATQAIDEEIWRLADLARRTPAVAAALVDATAGDALATLRTTLAAGAFVATFDALIERHGSRSQGWELTQPTWRERPEAALALVRARLATEGASPAELSAGSEARRREATERVLARLPAATHAEFSSALAHLDGFVRIREGRAYWQMVLSGELRTLLLRIGASLAAEGKIAAAEDVFFLEPDDFEDGAASDLRPIVGEQRRAWERWRAVEPPPLIGATGGPPATDAPARDGELRGSAASRGVVTGRARIIHSPEDGVRLQPGDILVCAASTPSWTPLFGVAAAIVSESGGPLSHPAITAREYGIPAVVAVKGATTAIRDGQTITVDGTAGVIRLA